jgi:hypothetical protein
MMLAQPSSPGLADDGGRISVFGRRPDYPRERRGGVVRTINRSASIRQGIQGGCAKIEMRPDKDWLVRGFGVAPSPRGWFDLV